MNGLSFLDVAQQLGQYDISLSAYSYYKGTPKAIVIRGEHQDFGIAAVHLDKDGTLVFDLGKEQP